MDKYTKRESKKLEKRKAILEAAEELFPHKGFANTTMQEISQKAGLAKGTLYLYFKSKEELYLTVCIQGIAGFGEAIENARRRARGPEEKIRAVYLTYIRHSLSEPNVFRVLRDAFLDPVRNKLSIRTMEQISAIVSNWLLRESELVKEGIRFGLFDPRIDPYLFSILAWRTATSLVELALLREPLVIESSALEALFEESIRLLLRGARNGGRGNERQGASGIRPRK